MRTLRKTKTDNQDIVFVYGALRSGTTVFRLMLDAHPGIGNPGEMDFLFDFLSTDNSHPTGWRYDLDGLRRSRIFNNSGLELTSGCEGLDLLESFFAQLRVKAPGNALSINLHRHVDRLFAVLPQARVLHILRDPRDVARSSMQMGWAGTLYHGVEHWIRTEKAWGQGIAGVPAEQVLEVTYESLFQDIDGTLQTVCDFFGVPFTADMLRYHENTTYGPPDSSLSEQWKRKCKPRELAELETRAASLMTARGYKPSQPATRLGTLARQRLKVQNTVYKWKFGMARFGVLNYWTEKLTRWAGMSAAHRKIKLRMQDTTRQNLK